MSGVPAGPAPGPLAGRTVVVCRPRGRLDALAGPLETLGARVERLPALAFGPPLDPAPLDEAARSVAGFDWVAFTSPRGVHALRDAMEAAGVGAPPGRVAVVGSSTAEACRAVGWGDPDLVPDRFDAEGLLEALDRHVDGWGGVRVLLPLAEAARDVLAAGLARRGARVTRVVAYRSTFPEDVPVASVRRSLEEGHVHLLTLTSPSIAANVLEAVGDAALAVPAAVIGPVTAEAAEGLGYRVAAVADPHTVEGLVDAVVRALAPELSG